MNALDRLRARLQTGVHLTCVSNTLRPARDGRTQVVDQPPRYDAVGCHDRDVRLVVFLPEVEEDVEWLDADTARWRIGVADHTVTYRFGQAA